MAIYYVRTDGSNSNNGLTNSAGGAWLTMTFAETQISPGDTVRVQAGTYNEKITISPGGSAGNYITFIADGNVICRGFGLNGSYLRVIGFEITHADLSFGQHAIGIGAFGSTASYIEIIDCNIHNVYGNGIRQNANVLSSYITIRGCNISYCGYIPGVIDTDGNVAIVSNNTRQDGSQGEAANHWLVEYNDISNVTDYMNVYGAYHILRNNYCHDAKVETPGGYHTDIFQPGSDLIYAGTKHHVVEANYAGNAMGQNAHFGIWQDVGHGTGDYAYDTDILIRGNVAFNFGSNFIGDKVTDHVTTYNNTLFRINKTSAGSAISFYKGSSDTKYPDYPVAVNTIIYDVNSATNSPAIFGYTDTGITGKIINNNLGYLVDLKNITSGFVVSGDPQFISTGTYDVTVYTGSGFSGALSGQNFRLKSTSPAIGSGTYISMITGSPGTGTVFSINNPYPFCDGFGMVSGDTVRVNGVTTRIINITGYNVTTLDAVSWTTGTPIYWGASSIIDIGALPYTSTELISGTYIQIGSTYTVTPIGDARGVWYYVDGIPQTWVSSPPYSATISSGTVTPKVYALYAQTVPYMTVVSGINGQVLTYRRMGRFPKFLVSRYQ